MNNFELSIVTGMISIFSTLLVDKISPILKCRWCCKCCFGQSFNEKFQRFQKEVDEIIKRLKTENDRALEHEIRRKLLRMSESASSTSKLNNFKFEIKTLVELNNFLD